MANYSLSGYSQMNSNPAFVDKWNGISQDDFNQGLWLQGSLAHNIANGTLNDAEGIPPGPPAPLGSSGFGGRPAASTVPVLPVSYGYGGGGGGTAIASANASTGPVDVNVNQSQSLVMPKPDIRQAILPTVLGALLGGNNNQTPPQQPAPPTVQQATAPPISPVQPGPQMPAIPQQAPAQSPVTPGTQSSNGALPFMPPPQSTPFVPPGQGGASGGGGGSPVAPGAAPARGAEPAQGRPGAANHPGPNPPAPPAGTPPQGGGPGAPMMGRFMGNVPPTSAPQTPQQVAMARAMQGQQTPGMPITAQAAGGATSDNGEQSAEADDGSGWTEDNAVSGYHGDGTPFQNQQFDPSALNTQQIDQAATEIHNQVVHDAATLGPRAKALADKLERDENTAQTAARAQFEPLIGEAQRNVFNGSRNLRQMAPEVMRLRAGQLTPEEWQDVNQQANQHAQRLLGPPPMAPAERKQPQSLGQQLGFIPRKGIRDFSDPMGVEKQREYGAQIKQYQAEFAKAKNAFMDHALNRAPAEAYKNLAGQVRQAGIELNQMLQAQDRAGRQARLLVAQQYKAQLEALKQEGGGLRVAESAASAVERNTNAKEKTAVANRNADTAKERAGTYAKNVTNNIDKEKRISTEHSSEEYHGLKQSEIEKNKAVAEAQKARAAKDKGGGFALPPPAAPPKPEEMKQLETAQKQQIPPIPTANESLEARVNRQQTSQAPQAPKAPPAPPKSGESPAQWIQRMRGLGYSQEAVKQRWQKYFPGGKVANAG